mgnify:CR=1 FL=1|jgi:hypothetical protein
MSRPEKMIEQDLPMVVPMNRRRLSRREWRLLYRVVSLALGLDARHLDGAELMYLNDLLDKIEPLKKKKCLRRVRTTDSDRTEGDY